MAEVLERQVERLSNRISNETDGDKAAESLLSLLGLLKNANDNCIDHLAKKNIPLMVVNVMKTNPKSSVVQKACCQLVSACYIAGGELQRLTIKCCAFDQVFTTILSNQEECSVLVQAFDTLHTLADHEDNLRALVNYKITQHLVLVLSQYEGQDIQMATLKLLALVLSQDHHKLLSNELLSAEAIGLITGAVKLFPDHPIIVASVLDVLAAVGCTDGNRHELSQSADCLSLANDCVRQHSKDPIVVKAYCKLMQNLSMSDDLDYATELLNHSQMNSVERDLVDTDVHNILIELLDSHNGNPLIQEHGLAALGHLAVLSGVVDVGDDDKLKNWLKIMLNALKTHISEPAVQAGACHCLAQVLVSRPDVVRWIGSDPHGQLIPVHSAIVLPLIVYNNDPQVYVAACSAIYHIMSSDDCNGAVLEELAERGVGSTLEGLREHRDNHICLEWGCRALRTLIMDSTDQKKYMEMCLALFDLISILEQQDSNPVLLGEAFAAITCLTDIKQLRKEACRQHIYTKVLDAVSKHPRNAFLSEVAIEQLTILLHYTEMVDILNDANTIPKVIHIMKEHIDIPSIQKKGCLLIRLLIKNDDVLTMQKNTSLSSSLATTVINALLHRRHDPDVLVEGLACVHALCELSDEIAGHFVTGGIHNLLLTILQQVEEDGDINNDGDYILDVAKAILSRLCDRTEYKHKMLSLAVKDNLLEGVNILIDMGADVNSYEDTDQSPICLAVQNNNHVMVLNLLAEGVRNVTRALNIAKHNAHHDIIGTLLRHIALEGNKESLDNKSSEVVDLSGLSLQKIKPEWILPALGSTTLLRRFSRPSLIHRLSAHKRNTSDSEVSVCSDAASELLDDNGDELPTDTSNISNNSGSTSSSIANSEPAADGYSTPKNKTGLRVGRFKGPDLPTIRSPMASLELHGNMFPYHEDGPTISPKSFEESVFDSPSSNGSPSRHRKNGNLYAKPVFELSITGAKSIPFHSKCRLKCTLEHSDSIFPPITNDFCTRARSMRRPPPSRGNSRAPSPLPGIIHDMVDVRQYLVQPQQDVLPLHINNSQTRVRKLNLSCNGLSSLDSLDADGSRSRALYERLRKLEILELHQNNLESLPEQLFKKLTSLAVLNLRYNQFEFFPKESLYSNYMTELDLSNNKIRKLPTFTQQPHITLLSLNCNQLREFPIIINGTIFPRLAKLYLSSNLMTVIPDQRYELRNLQELVIAKNKLPEIPCVFMRDMESLNLLNASDNEIVRLPGKDGGYLGQLHIVKLNNNLLGKNEENFYHFVTALPSLHVLEARHNGLSSLYPPTAWSSRCIRDLDLCDNKIEELNLDHCHVRWSELERLMVGNNRITRIPPELGRIKTLCCLDFSHNPDITKLPDELGNLSSLYVLKIDGLKKLSIDATILSGTTRMIINFLEARLHKSERYYQMKLLVVGGPAKGKTTLIEYLIRGRTLRSPIATLGVNIREWSYEQRPGEVYHLSCWDFAGQGEFYTTHQCFLTTRSLYMVVYDLSKGEEELATISPWLLNIQARAPSSPILVVGTHRDLIAERFLNAKRMMRSRILGLTDRPGFPSSSDIAFAEVSCIDGKGMKELKLKLKDLVDNAKVKGQKIMGGYVPSYYLVLAELIKQKALEVAQTPFPVMYEEELQRQISQEVYHGRMQSLSNSELEQAIHFLHQCGVLLHYSDCQTELGRLYFLNPVWLCKLMARVITIPEVNPLVSNRGLLPISQLGLILRPPEFPDKFITEYIRLLERFEVAFRHHPDELLIPSHLPKRRPIINLPPSIPGGKIVRRYRMCYIPPGFWPRLTARLLIFPKRALQVFNQHQSCFSNNPITQCWSHGVYSVWTDQAYFLVEQLDDQVFDITLPSTNWGTRLLCAVVDNVEAMIDEWYPGLRDFDVATGKKLVTSGTLCPHCPVDQDLYCFQLKDLENKSHETDEVMCPVHKGTVLMEQLAPDIIINDIDDSLKIKPGEFALDESIPNLLGRGGFGEVYKARHQGKTVAVKVFSTKSAELNGTTPTHLIRQEVSILSYLSHPNIVSLVGVCMRPKPMLLLEYATLGSLRQQQYKTISYNMKHSIMAQVASGLAYLHKNDIIYRDLKADNVLIFSLNPTASVNAKISDYGIACFATASGLTLDTGTTGHKAPEVMKGRSLGTYNKEADLYSYGVLLFSLITNYKPFDDLPAGRVQDKAIKENKPIHNIQHYGCPPWPDMEQLIISCLQENPTLRPTAQQVYDRLCTAELIGLKVVIPTHSELSVEAFTFRTFICEKTNSPNVEVWMVSLCGSMTVFSVINLTQKNALLKGKILTEKSREKKLSNICKPASGIVESDKEGSIGREVNREYGNRINCILTVDSNTILMGSHTGVIYVYDGYRNQKNKLPALPSPVLSMLHFQTHKGDHYVCAGLLNGYIALYDQYLLQIEDDQLQAKMFNMGNGPISCMKRHHHKLYVCSGEEVLVINIVDFTVQERWNATHPNFRGMALRCLVIGLNMIWTAQRHCSYLQLWDIETTKYRGTLPCHELVKSHLEKEGHDCPYDSHDLRVTSLYLKEAPLAELWVGLGSGHLLIVNASTRVPLMVVQRHLGPVRCMDAVKATVTGKNINLVLTGSYGFVEQPYSQQQNTDKPPNHSLENYGSLLVWDAAMPQLKPVMDKYKEKQKIYQ